MSVTEWPLLADDFILKTPVFEVRKFSCRSPKDVLGKNFSILQCPDWVQTLAVTPDEKAVLVRQYRQGTREISLELPGGVIEPGQTPLEAGRRELMEETGYAAEAFHQLAAFRPNPAIQTNTAYAFVADNAVLSGPTNFDPNEDLDLVLAPLEELRDLVLQGKIDHVIMVAAILFYFSLKR
jgi:8-oxo-dGTP pyrophosphatase MutT (NUDIX family)